MSEETPEFWEWVKNKIREREQQQPLQIEIQLPIPSNPVVPTNGSYDIYEEVDHEIKSDIYQMKATSMVAFSFVNSTI